MGDAERVKSNESKGVEGNRGRKRGWCRGGNECVGYLSMLICRVLRACAVITVI